MTEWGPKKCKVRAGRAPGREVRRSLTSGTEERSNHHQVRKSLPLEIPQSSHKSLVSLAANKFRRMTQDWPDSSSRSAFHPWAQSSASSRSWACLRAWWGNPSSPESSPGVVTQCLCWREGKHQEGEAWRCSTDFRTKVYVSELLPNHKVNVVLFPCFIFLFSDLGFREMRKS